MKTIWIAVVFFLLVAPAAGLADARTDYKGHCANCHGANPLLAERIARKFGVDPRKMSLTASKMNKDEMIAVVEKGKNKMPAFEGKLTKEQIVGIVDYLLEYRAQQIRKESLIRIKEPASPNPVPVTEPGKNQEARP